jgi:hypothetical protein
MKLRQGTGNGARYIYLQLGDESDGRDPLVFATTHPDIAALLVRLSGGMTVPNQQATLRMLAGALGQRCDSARDVHVTPHTNCILR